MNVLHPCMSVTGSFGTADALPQIPELAPYSVFDRDAGRHDMTSKVKGEIRIRLDQIELERVFAAFTKHNVRVVRHWLHTRYESGFWNTVPDDCAGGFIWPDGWVSIDRDTQSRLVSLSEPFYITGRPEFDAEHERRQPHYLDEGGIPIVGDALLGTLRDLGAEGKTADILYRGHNKAAYDTVQKGFKRFLAEPQYALNDDKLSIPPIRILPDTLPEDFGVCCFLITHLGRSWYDLALSRTKALKLRSLRRTVLLIPLFRKDGAMDKWVQQLNTGVKSLTP